MGPGGFNIQKLKRIITIRELKPDSTYGNREGPKQLERYAIAWLKQVAKEPDGPRLVRLDLFLDLYARNAKQTVPATQVGNAIDHSADENDGDNLNQ